MRIRGITIVCGILVLLLVTACEQDEDGVPVILYDLGIMDVATDAFDSLGEAVDERIGDYTDSGAGSSGEGRSAGGSFNAADRDPEELARQLEHAEEAVIEVVNEYRGEHDLQPLEHNHALADLARGHSRDMGERDYLAHESPDGVTMADRLDSGLPDGYSYNMAAENIAYRQGPGDSSDASAKQFARAIVDQWMGSPGHRANILLEDITHIGVGLYPAGQVVYGTQKFARFSRMP